MNSTTPKHNPMAAEMAAAQIATYDADIQRLDDQIRNAEARKEALKSMREALLPLAASQSASLSGASQHETQEETESDPSAGKGFNSAIRVVLQQSPRGLKPHEVLEQMQSSGLTTVYTGKTPIAIRVANELYRMMKSGKLQRRAGRYFFPNSVGSQ